MIDDCILLLFPLLILMSYDGSWTGVVEDFVTVIHFYLSYMIFF